MLRNVAHLQAFHWIARLGSFRAAAERLGVTQPTISIRLRELERSVGVRLIERNGHRARLTADGSSVHGQVETLLALVDTLEGRFRHGQPLRGSLRLGVSDGFALVCLARLMKLLQRHHPQLVVSVVVGNSRVLEGRLLHSEVDLAVLSWAGQTAELEVEPLGLQEVAWIGAAELRLPAVAGPADLLGQTIFTDAAPSHLFSVLMDWFAASGLTPPPLALCDSVAVIATLVASGAGISVLPLCVMQGELERGAVRVIRTDPALPRQRIVVATRAGDQESARRAVVALVRTTCEETGFVSELADPPRAGRPRGRPRREGPVSSP